MQRPIDYSTQVIEIDRDVIASHSLEGTISRLRELNLLKGSNPLCDNCVRNITRVVHDESRLDGQFYRCYQCLKKKSLRHSLVLENTRLPIGCLLRLMIAFTQQMGNNESAEYSICSISSVQCVFKFFRKAISHSIQQERQALQLVEVNGQLQGGIEVDESLFSHIFNLGEDRYEQQVWVLGLVECNSDRYVIYVLGNQRTTEVIRPLIARHVATSQANRTHIYTDGALWYNYLSEDHYNHTRIIHQGGFGRGDDTTNHVESLWSRLKRAGRFDEGKNFSTIQEVQEELNLLTWLLRTPKQQRIAQMAILIQNKYQADQITIVDQ